MVRITFASILTLCLIAATSAQGAIIVNLSPGAGSGTNIEITGSGVINGGVNEIINFNNFPVSFTAIGFNDSQSFAAAISVSGTRLNSGNAYSQDLISVTIDGSKATPDFDLNLTAGSFFNVGDTYSVNGSTTLDGLAFADLIPGTYVPGNGGDTSNVGGLTLNIVPEPTSMALASVGLALIAFRRRR